MYCETFSTEKKCAKRKGRDCLHDVCFCSKQCARWCCTAFPRLYKEVCNLGDTVTKIYSRSNYWKYDYVFNKFSIITLNKINCLFKRQGTVSDFLRVRIITCKF